VNEDFGEQAGGRPGCVTDQRSLGGLRDLAQIGTEIDPSSVVGIHQQPVQPSNRVDAQRISSSVWRTNNESTEPSVENFRIAIG